MLQDPGLCPGPEVGYATAGSFYVLVAIAATTVLSLLVLAIVAVLRLRRRHRRA